MRKIGARVDRHQRPDAGDQQNEQQGEAIQAEAQRNAQRRYPFKGLADGAGLAEVRPQCQEVEEQAGRQQRSDPSSIGIGAANDEPGEDRSQE